MRDALLAEPPVVCVVGGGPAQYWALMVGVQQPEEGSTHKGCQNHSPAGAEARVRGLGHGCQHRKPPYTDPEGVHRLIPFPLVKGLDGHQTARWTGPKSGRGEQ